MRSTIKSVTLTLTFALAPIEARAQRINLKTGTIVGTTFRIDGTGKQVLIPSVHVQLIGSSPLATTSDSKGRYLFASVPGGTYAIEAQLPGLAAVGTISAKPGETVHVPLEMKSSKVTRSVRGTVTASNTKPEQPGNSRAIRQSTFINAPNADARFAGALPLIPGVVRGPGGGINLKDTQGTQGDMLLDSVNVTDPAASSTFDHTASMAQPAQVIGTVVDLQGDAIPGAKVVLTHPGSPYRSTLSSDANGFFKIDDVEPGVSSQIVVSAIGFDDWTSPALVLKPGQVMSLGGISLKLAAQNTTLTVRYNPVETATEQLKAEERQRILGIIPNFYVSYEGQNAAPMTAKMKFQLALRASFDPVTIGGAALWAGIRQATDTPNYQQGWTGYGERFGAVSLDGFSHLMISDAILQSALHEDPRYFYQGTGTTKSRLLHAISSPFWSRRDNGTWGPNYSNLGGDLVSSALTNLYYPKSNRGAGLVFSQFAIGTAEHVVNGLAEEFILSRFTHRRTNQPQ